MGKKLYVGNLDYGVTDSVLLSDRMKSSIYSYLLG
jgi:hypothetical protein